MLVTIPRSLTCSILSFGDFHDTLKIATLNRRCLDAVEAFCRQKLNEIRNAHQVDEFWEQRLGAQADQANSGHLARLTNRQLLKCAQKTHFYSLGGRRDFGTKLLACLPDGNTLVSASNLGYIHVWDLSTQKCVHSFRSPTGYPKTLCLSPSGHVVYATLETVSIFTLEGQLMHCIEDEGDLDFMVASGDRLFCVFHNFDDESDELVTVARLVDIPSGTQIQTLQGSWSEDMGNLICCVACGDWFLLLLYEEEESERDGIFVLDKADLAQVSHFHGRFRAIETSNNGSSIVAFGLEDGEVNVLEMSSGELIQTNSFSVGTTRSRAAQEDTQPDLWLLSGSLLFFTNEETSYSNAIGVFDIQSGKRVTSLRFPRHDAFHRISTLASNGREFFCGFLRRRYKNFIPPGESRLPSYPHLPSIHAYPCKTKQAEPPSDISNNDEASSLSAFMQEHSSHPYDLYRKASCEALASQRETIQVTKELVQCQKSHYELLEARRKELAEREAEHKRLKTTGLGTEK